MREVTFELWLVLLDLHLIIRTDDSKTLFDILTLISKDRQLDEKKTWMVYESDQRVWVDPLVSLCELNLSRGARLLAF